MGDMVLTMSESLSWVSVTLKLLVSYIAFCLLIFYIKKSFKKKPGYYKCVAPLFYYKFKSAQNINIWNERLQQYFWSTIELCYYNNKQIFLIFECLESNKGCTEFEKKELIFRKSRPECLIVSFNQFVIGKPVYILLTLSQSSFWSGWAEKPSQLSCRDTQYIKVFFFLSSKETNK